MPKTYVLDTNVLLHNPSALSPLKKMMCLSPWWWLKKSTIPRNLT